jgi:hypothetical protein
MRSHKKILNLRHSSIALGSGNLPEDIQLRATFTWNETGDSQAQWVRKNNKKKLGL